MPAKSSIWICLVNRILDLEINRVDIELSFVVSYDSLVIMEGAPSPQSADEDRRTRQGTAIPTNEKKQ